MKLTNNDLQSFAQAELRTFNLSDFKINRTKALKDISKEILSEWDKLNSNDVMESRASFFKVPGTQANDYAEKLLELSNGRKVIYGIRHMGGKREIPFIFLRPNFEITDSIEVVKVYSKVKDEFEQFKPQYICFWSPTQLEVDFIGSTYLVSKAGNIKSVSAWDNEDDIELRKVLDDSFYEWYKAGYEEFHTERPDLKNKVTVNSIDSMRNSVEHGLMYEAFINGKKAGLIAGEKSSLLGHSGVYFHEIFISRDFKGKGLAKALQRKFIKECTQDDDFIWGTVDSHNLPSYKTAMSNGRVPIRYECFIKI